MHVINLGSLRLLTMVFQMTLLKKLNKMVLVFFAKPMFAIQQADLANPLGYGHKNIGSNGDMGELEYLLLSTHLSYIAEKYNTISNDPSGL